MRPKFAGQRISATALLNDFNNQLRESKINAYYRDPSKLVGAGSYGRVFESPNQGMVIKQNHPHRFADDLETEVNLQAIGAELGVSPAISYYEKFPEGTQRIEMRDIRQNYAPASYAKTYDGPIGMDAVRVNQQLGMLALKGVDLTDRHINNMQFHQMTGRPTQFDYGLARRVEGEDQVAALANATERGLAAAGLPDEGMMVSEIVYDYLAGGQVAEAMDIAKQGFSRLQKIKAPLTQNSMDEDDLAFAKMMKMMEAQGRERGLI